MSYLVFIKQHSSSSREYSDTAVPVLTNRGLLCPGQERVHFSEEYGNIKLPEKLPGTEKTLLLILTHKHQTQVNMHQHTFAAIVHIGLIKLA